MRPAIPGAGDPEVFTLRNMGDMDAILATVARNGVARALVVGAGYVGLELAEQLQHRGLSVTLVEKLDHVLGLADAEMTFPLQEELARHGVEVRLGRSVAAFERVDGEAGGGSWTTGTGFPATWP